MVESKISRVRPGVLESFGNERGIWNGGPRKNTSREWRHS